jgi:amyloid beta precursor protein binding protein 1
LEVTRLRSIAQELDSPEYEDFMNEFYDDESLAPWLVTVRAVEEFRQQNGRYPGETESQMDDDFNALKTITTSIMQKVIPDDSIKLDDKYIKEIVRFSDSKLHSVSAFLGGVASQEAIKILIR